MITLLTNQHLLPFRQAVAISRTTTKATLFFLTTYCKRITAVILLPPLRLCPEVQQQCFRARVLRDRMLTSERHGHPLVWSEEPQTHH